MTTQPGSSAEDAETGAGHEPSPTANGARPSESRHSPAPVVPLISPSSAQNSAHTHDEAASLVARGVSSDNHALAQSSVAQSTAAVSADTAAASASGAATLDDLAHTRKRKRSTSPFSASTLPAPPSTSSPSSSSSAPATLATVAHSTPPSLTNGTGATETSFNALSAPASAAPTMSVSFGFGSSSIAPLVPASASSIPSDAAAERQRLSVSVPRFDLAADPATAAQSLISSPSRDSIIIASAPPAKRMNRSRTPPAAAITAATTDSAPAPAPAPAASSSFIPSPSPSSFNTTSPTLVPIPITAASPLSAQPVTLSSAATPAHTDGSTSAPSGSVPMSPAAPAALSDTPATRSVAVTGPIAGEPVHDSEKRSTPADLADDAQQGRPLDGAAPISLAPASPSSPAAAAPAESSLLDRSSADSAAAKPVPAASHPDSCDASNFQIPRARSSSTAAAAETHSAAASASSHPSNDALKNSDLAAPLRQNSISVNIPSSSPRLEGGGASDGADLAKSDLRSNASTSDPVTDSAPPATNPTTLASPLSGGVVSQAVDHLESGAESPTGLATYNEPSSSSTTLSRPSAIERNGGAGQAASPSSTVASSLHDPAPPSQPASESNSETHHGAPSRVHIDVESADEPSPAKGTVSIALSTAVASEQSTPSAQTPQPASTISTLQLASEALSSIPHSGSRGDANVNSAAAELLTALHHRSKKASAIRSPHPGSVRSRSAATTPVPPSLLLGLKHDSLDVTAQSSRATTPTRTPSGRSKRRRRERNAAATPTAAMSALPSIEATDRRRSARVAKAVTETASDKGSTPNLALFGFSPYLENLVMNAKETDRRTRSGGRTVRPPVEKAPARGKRSAGKNKIKEADPDGPDDEAKSELYRQLCILSYQLQAELDMVPVQSLDQLRARFASPPPADKADDSHNTDPGLEANANRLDTLDPVASGYDRPQMASALESVANEPIVKTEPPQSPQLTHAPASHARPAYSPESSPEVALMDTARATYGTGPSLISASYAQGPYPSYESYQPHHQPYSWGHKAEFIEDDPMSPIPRPARSNIMSISALMSGPSPRARSPTPPRTPPFPPVPMFMQAWTHEDEMASQILQACAAAIPKLDTTELDRLTKIAQLAAFDLPPPWTEETGQDDSDEAERADRERYERFSKFAPGRLNPLDTLDTKELYAREEAEYLDEAQASGELYESIRYLSNFDEIVDEWRAGELSRLRLQLEMRKDEIERIWTCDRKLAWSNYINDRAGPLYREAAFEARHAQWQAEMELDLLAVHRRKTRGYAKLTHNIWTPQTAGVEDPDSAALYQKFGRFLFSSKYAEAEDPFVRADLRKMQKAWREHRRQTRKSERAQQEAADDADRPASETALSGEEEVGELATSIASSEASDWDESYDSDSSYMSSESGISSLPSFSSVYSSPRMPSVADIDVVISDADGLMSEAVSLRGADSDSDGDADESLWARQLRLANQSTASKEATDVSAAASGLQTPAEVGDGARSVVSSRAPSPAPSSKLDQDQQPRDRKRKRKKPPPPGARLWKKGRVQQDPPDEKLDEVAAESMQAQQVDDRYGESDRIRSSPKRASALGFDAAQAGQHEPSRFAPPEEPRSNMIATPSYAGYGASGGYGGVHEFDYDRARAIHDPYAQPSYPVYQHGYPAFQEPPMPRYSEDAPMPDARYGYPRVTPPREMHDARYAYPYPPPPRAAAYPPANPPPPHPPSQWRY